MYFHHYFCNFHYHLVFLPQSDGGYGVYGEGGIPNGRDDAPPRVAWPFVHPDADGLRLQCAGDYGSKGHQRPERSRFDNADGAVYELLSATAGVYSFYRCFLPKL